MTQGATIPVVLRLERATLAEIDACVAELSAGDAPVTRTGFLRRLIEKALRERKKRK